MRRKQDGPKAGPSRAIAPGRKGGGAVDKPRPDVAAAGAFPPDVADSRYGDKGTGDPGTVYLRKHIHCGKAGCKCGRGEPHGPYWYAFLRDAGGRQRARYIGKHFRRIPAAAWVRPPRKRKGSGR